MRCAFYHKNVITRITYSYYVALRAYACNNTTKNMCVVEPCEQKYEMNNIFKERDRVKEKKR